MWINVDESLVQVGDVLMMFETGPYGVATVVGIGEPDEWGYRVMRLIRPYVYAYAEEPGASAENYSAYLRPGRTVTKWDATAPLMARGDAR